MTYRNTNKRDANEGPIVELWRAAGCELIQLRPGQGADWVVIASNGVHVVEIKNPDGWQYTDAELALKNSAEELGQRYETVFTIEDAARMIGR